MSISKRGRLGDEETKRWGDWEMGRLGDEKKKSVKLHG